MMARQTPRTEAVPFGWVEISSAALQRLRRELEQKGQGVVDEMGVLAIHTGYADYFFPGTSVLQTRPRYLFFVCWNFLWLARQRGITASNLAKRKDDADLWMTRKLVETDGQAASAGGKRHDMQGIIGERVFREDPPRLPAQRVDFVYWTALREWGLYRSRTAHNRAQLFRRWRGSAIGRVGEDVDEGQDDAIRDERLAELMVPPVPTNWQDPDSEGLDFELSGPEARWLQERLLALDEVAEGPRLLAKAAELCADTPPRMAPDARPWDDPLAIEAARAARQSDRLQRARQASALAHYVRTVYAALVERVVEITASPHRDPPLRHYRDRLARLAADGTVRDASLSLALPDLYADVPRIPGHLRRVLEHVQSGLRRVGRGEKAQEVFMNDDTHRLFEAVERDRKGSRARLARTDQGAARRVGFGPDTVGVYDLDYRWNRVRYLLWDLHHGLARV